MKAEQKKTKTRSKSKTNLILSWPFWELQSHALHQNRQQALTFPLAEVTYGQTHKQEHNVQLSTNLKQKQTQGVTNVIC